MVEGGIYRRGPVDCVPSVSPWSVGGGFKLHLGRRRGVTQGLWRHGRILLGSNVNSPDWCVGSRSQLTSGGQRTCPHEFCGLGWCVRTRMEGEGILICPVSPSAAKLCWTGCSGRWASSHAPPPSWLRMGCPYSPPGDLTWIPL